MSDFYNKKSNLFKYTSVKILNFDHSNQIYNRGIIPTFHILSAVTGDILCLKII